MIEVRRLEDGEAQIYVDPEDAMGTAWGVNLTDHAGLKLILDLTAFYKAKGINVDQLVARAPMGGAGFWNRVRQAVAHVIGG